MHYCSISGLSVGSEIGLPGLNAMAAERGSPDVASRAARHDAKAPSFEFANDSEAKQQEASELIRTLAERHLGDVYRHLEDLRAGSKPG